MVQKLYTGDAMQANLSFVTKQTSHIEAGVYRARYPQIRYPGLIPIDTSAPEWIKSVTYYSMDTAGAAAWMADRASDIPVVGSALASSETQVHMAAIGYDYGIEEIAQAAALGMNLAGEKANTARLIYERFVDQVAFLGSKEKGFEGLLNASTVTVENAATGNWDNATADQIIADINIALSGVFKGTNEMAMADTLLLPSLKYQKLASTRLGDTETTALDFIKKANVFKAETGQDLTIRGMRGLNEAGAGGTSRMVAYRNSPEVLKMHIPMVHKFLPVQIEGLTYKIPGIFRLGGLDIRLPREVRYVDGI